MLKTIHVLFLSIVCTSLIQAQDTLLHETFNDMTLGQFTAYSQLGDGEMWEPREFNEKFFVQMNGFNDGIQDNIDWLISPALDMDANMNEILTFDNASNFDGPNLELLLSTDYAGGDPTAATWTDISTGVTWSPGGYEYVSSGSIDLSAVTGTAHFALRYTSNSGVQGKLFQVDDIVVTAGSTDNVFQTEITNWITRPVINNGQLEFSVLENSQTLSARIASMNGAEIARYDQLNHSSLVQLPLTNLANGAYVLILERDGQIASFTFVY